jgi:iron(III) transport system permease protein
MAVNELTVSALLWSAGNETLGVLIFNLNESGENALASAVAVVIIAFVATLMGVLGLFASRLPKGVIPWRI